MNILESIDSRYYEILKTLIGIAEEEIKFVENNQDLTDVKEFLEMLELALVRDDTLGYANLEVSLNKVRRRMKCK